MGGFILLSVQVWARTALHGLTRQNVEEWLRPFVALFGILLACSTVVATIQRHRGLALLAALIALLSAFIVLLPILLQEGVRD